MDVRRLRGVFLLLIVPSFIPCQRRHKHLWLIAVDVVLTILPWMASSAKEAARISPKRGCQDDDAYGRLYMSRCLPRASITALPSVSSSSCLGPL